VVRGRQVIRREPRGYFATVPTWLAIAFWVSLGCISSRSHPQYGRPVKLKFTLMANNTQNNCGPLNSIGGCLN
jgi:hypothetical protein